MLSIADFILAVLWIAGGGIWLSADPYHFKHSRKNCFVILLATVVRNDVALNILYVGYKGCITIFTHLSLKKKQQQKQQQKQQ